VTRTFIQKYRREPMFSCRNPFPLVTQQRSFTPLHKIRLQVITSCVQEDKYDKIFRSEVPNLMMRR